MGKWKRRLWKWSAGAFAALVILLATVAGLFRLVTPLVPSYRLQIEQWASTQLQHPVEIHSMGADWSWIGPEVTLQEVSLLSRDGSRKIVAAQEVRLSLDWRAVIHGRLPKPSRVVLIGPRLEVERDLQGDYAIRGLGKPGQNANTDWHATLQEALGESAEIVVREGQVALFDARRAMPLVFQRIGVRIDNTPADHSLHGEVLLPAELGRSFGFDLSIQGEGVDFSKWDWQLHSQGQGLQLAKLLTYAPLQQIYLAAGSADLSLDAASKQDQLQHAELNLDAHGLVSAPPLRESSVPLLQGDFQLNRTASGWRAQVRHLLLQRAGAAIWPKDDLDLEFAHAGDGDSWSGDADFLRLQDVAALSAWAPPLTEEQLKRLQAFAPTGDVTGLAFKLRWDGKAAQDWSVKAGFKDLGVHAAEGLPGFASMDGDIDMADSGGKARLDTPDGQLDFRPLFRGVFRGGARLNVRANHDAQGWRVATDGFEISNPDAAAHGRAALQFPDDGTAPVLDLDASVERADARNKSLYLPVGIMPLQVVSWLDHSIKSGEVTSGSVAIHGKTSDFPFRDDKKGTFDIQFHVQHAELDYFPGWPVLKDMDADVRFLDQGLTAKAHGGSIDGLTISDGSQAGFAELASGVLKVDGGAKGPAGGGLDFLRNGPLKKNLDGLLDDFAAGGQVGVDVHFTLPVTQAKDFTLQGSAALHDVNIWPRSAPGLAATHLNGTVEFGNYGFSTNGVHGLLLGGPVAVVVQQSHAQQIGILVDVRGEATATGIATALGYGSDRWLYGRTTWQVQGRVPLEAGPQALDLELHSDLAGLAMDIPDPIGKTADEERKLDVSLKQEAPETLSVSGGYDDALGLRLDFITRKGASGFDRGELRIGEAAVPRPAERGLALTGDLDSFDWDQWKPLLPPEPSNTSAASTGPGDRSSVIPAFLRSVDLSVGHAAGFDQSIDDLHLTLTRNDAGWLGHVDSTPLAGNLAVPTRVDAEHPVVLNMDRVLLADKSGGLKQIAKQAVDPNRPKAAAKLDPRSIPALRFSIKQFQFGAMALSNLSLSLMPRPDGIVLEDVKVADPSFAITGDGAWTIAPDGQQSTLLNADVESKDVGRSLQSLGFDGGLTGDKGSIVASLNWRDSPMGDVVPTLGGTIHVDLRNGQITEVKPGAGRLFGLLSITALPRRLLLNFSDVFGKGFGYDSITGDFTLQEGDAYTQNMLIKGPAASIHLLGRTGLAKQDFDEALIVDASVGSSLPIVAGLAGGLVPGAVVFLLTQIFQKPLTKAGEVRYHLTGTWDTPVLTKMNSSAAPAPATAAKP